MVTLEESFLHQNKYNLLLLIFLERTLIMEFHMTFPSYS